METKFAPGSKTSKLSESIEGQNVAVLTDNLKLVAQYCVWDAIFREALITEPEAALAQQHITLSQFELETLKTYLLIISDKSAIVGFYRPNESPPSPIW